MMKKLFRKRRTRFRNRVLEQMRSVVHDDE